MITRVFRVLRMRARCRPTLSCEQTTLYELQCLHCYAIFEKKSSSPSGLKKYHDIFGFLKMSSKIPKLYFSSFAPYDSSWNRKKNCLFLKKMELEYSLFWFLNVDRNFRSSLQFWNQLQIALLMNNKLLN